MATATAARARAREYETIYVLRQDVDPDSADKVAGRVAEVVARENGRLVKVEAWGRRRLAYTVGKQRKGVYYYVKYLGNGSVVAELERNFRMLDTVLRFQTVQLRDEVDVDSVVVDPEEVKFTRLEPPPEDEHEDSPEKALGLVDQPDERPRRDSEFSDDVNEDEGLDEDWVEPGKASAKPAAASDAKVDAKADAKVDAKVDAKADAKVDAKADAKTEETP
jgi:small subunit ribosomal protein S6